MATTNLQQWNPGAVNQETDAQYTADPQRTGGAVDDSPFPASTANKLFYQASTFYAAFGMMLANKGISTSDADINVLAAALANILTSVDFPAAIITVPFSTAPVFTAGTSNGFAMSLSGNVTASTITGMKPGQLLAFYFGQDGIGGRTVNWPSGFFGAVQPDPTPGSTTLFLFRVDSTGTNALTAAPAMSTAGSGAAFIAALNAASITLRSGAPQGSFLLGNGATFVALSRKRRFPGWATGTVQQNTTGYPLTVYTTHVSGGGGGTQTAYVGSTNPPTQIVAQSSPSTGLSSDAMDFEVLPGEFYKVTVDAGSLSIIVECYFG